MNKKELTDLKKRVMTNRSLYEEKIKQFTKEVDQKIKENNLSYDNDNDIDKIVDIDMKVEEKYKTDELYKNWTTDADIFIINGLKYTVEKRPKTITEKQIIPLKELITLFEKDKSKLIIYRKRALDILFEFDFLNN